MLAAAQERLKAAPLRTAVILALLAVLALSIPLRAQSADPLQKEMYNQEHGLAKAETDKDRAYFDRTLDDGVIFVAYNGLVFTKLKIVEGVALY